MEWQMVVALIIAVPLIIFPAALVWYLNVSGIFTVWRESRARGKRRARARKEALVQMK